MVEYRRCALKEEHEGHTNKLVVTETCSGLTACGQPTHAGHEFQATKSFWCSGLCFCGINKEIHGPGAHK